MIHTAPKAGSPVPFGGSEVDVDGDGDDVGWLGSGWLVVVDGELGGTATDPPGDGVDVVDEPAQAPTTTVSATHAAVTRAPIDRREYAARSSNPSPPPIARLCARRVSPFIASGHRRTASRRSRG
jgi:hypothetical protein